MRVCAASATWRRLAVAAGLGVALTFAGHAGARDAALRAPAVVLEVDGAIGPATTEYLHSGLAAARQRGSPLVILRMNTPGGLDAATRDIIADILASPVPVATFVAPAGARAASAGTYILYASHLAAMAPGTHLGAATPVMIGGAPSPLPGSPRRPQDEGKDARPQTPDAMTAKAVNDSAAYIASLAALHGRNADWAERAVREAATLTSAQAKQQGVIEIVAADVGDLLAQADGRAVRLGGQSRKLETAGRSVIALEPSWRVRTLAVITNPNIAYLLLLIGLYGILFEFMSPGMVAPGVIGAIALLTALFALNLLPVSSAGVALLVLGLALMAAEAFAPSFGALGIGGVVALALGSLMLFRGPIPEYRLSPWVVAAAVGLSLAFFFVALGSALRARRAALAIGPSTLRRARGRVVLWSGERGLVQVQGEDWQARADQPLRRGEAVRVAGRDGLVLLVEPDPQPDSASPADPAPP